MSAIDHYQDRIARATERLAQLQARDLLARQRRDSKAKDLEKREQSKRLKRIAELAVLAGADKIDDDELLGVLSNHMDTRSDPSVRQFAVERGELLLHNVDRGSPRLR
ncbi:conjugal transfer protein TraD [Xanthomonas translucens pv. poae]|uniref:conjugal transfer protein TraD n=1 Tax=Xanthomonas graminis TaxID=3390026 RepID=UPI0009BBC218|nr:conjugal transfer protein TraD [Xanthomonas translucens]UKE63356.1 conjugal transfer protein TraD [Xanthomonas translucens pv. poae]